LIIVGGTYSVYVHTNTINNKVYVGTTSKVPAYKRWCINSGAGYKKNKRFYDNIQKYGWENFEHEIIASGLNEDEASNMERILIDKLNSTNPEFGYNTERGGLRKNESARREKISKTLSSGNHPKLGTHLDEEMKKRIGDAMRGEKGYWYGKKLPQETLDKMSTALKGRKITDTFARINEERKKTVVCVETGIVYESITKAAEALGVNHVSISRAVNGKQETAYGKHWKLV